MAKIEHFEDLEIWQKARILTQSIIQITKRDGFSRDFVLRDQAYRAAVSIMSNVAEGFERGGTKEFVQFLSLAKGSSGELRSHLYIVRDQGYCAEAEFDKLRADALEISRMISGMISYLRKSSMKGTKFK